MTTGIRVSSDSSFYASNNCAKLSKLATPQFLWIILNRRLQTSWTFWTTFGQCPKCPKRSNRQALTPNQVYLTLRRGPSSDEAGHKHTVPPSTRKIMRFPPQIWKLGKRCFSTNDNPSETQAPLTYSTRPTTGQNRQFSRVSFKPPQ